jgi:ligand-binding sensor domain-containing protein
MLSVKQIIGSVIFLSLCSITSFAQSTNQYFFQHIDHRDGLAHDNVFDITQDDRGFIWIITPNGLQRYDGSRFLNYQEMMNDPDDPILAGGKLYADHKSGCLWIIRSDRMEKLELIKNKFSSLKFSALTHDPSFQYDPYTDENHTTWLIGDNAVFIVDSAGNKMIALDITIQPLASHKSNSIILDTVAGQIWMISWGKGLLLADKRSKKIYSSGHNSIRHPMLTQLGERLLKNKTGSRNIMQDSHHNFWVTSWNDSLYRYNTATNKLVVYSLTTIVKEQPVQSKNNSPLLVSAVFEDNRGAIWITTENAGLLKYDPVKDRFDCMVMNEENTKNNRYNFQIFSIFQDREENIWLGTDNGITVFNPYRQYFQAIRHEENNKASLPNSEIQSMIQAVNGDILVGTWGGGITVYDSAWRFKKNMQFNGPFEYNLVWDFVQNDDGSIWAGCQHGYIHIYDPLTGSVKTIRPAECNGYTIRCMTKDAKGNIWMGLHNGALVKWDKQQSRFYSFAANCLHEKSSISPITYIFFDRQHNCWLSTWYGLKKFDIQKEIISDNYVPEKNNPYSISAKTIEGIEQYDDSSLVIGTVYGGFNFFNTKSKGFYKITSHDGFPPGTIYTIRKDAAGYLWFTTDYGLYKCMLPTKKVTHYSMAPGTINSSFKLAGFWVLKNGEWATLTSTEIICFDPVMASHQNSNTAKVEIAGLRIADKPLFIDSLLVANKPVYLNWRQNFLSIEFVLLRFSDPQRARYNYHLSGIDKDWVNADMKNFASYTNLPPGKYVFSVKADNGDDTTNVTSFTIIITPPFWNTWWFAALVALAAAGCIFWLVKRRIKNIRSEAELKRQVIETQMTALRAQMNPHFIFNCLNSIDNLIQDNEKEKATSYLARFSKLIRAILENSKQEFIPVWKDIEMLKLYLELEALRCDNKFMYKLNIDEELLQGDYKIPPLLIQPFVENAIHHGLLNKTSNDRTLSIAARPLNGRIKFIIEDNGIGRQEAEKIKQLNKPAHQSMGLHITRERINLLNKNGKQETIKITDLATPGTHAAGTRVEIILENK